MEPTTMLRGMANVSYWAEDLKKARQWYTDLFGIEPYFQLPNAENPGYIEFRVSDYLHEVGIIDKKYRPAQATDGPGGAILNWHVDDINKAIERLVDMGAIEFEPITQRGEGFITASVIDPFGNVLGIMYNQHYLDILNQKLLRYSYGNERWKTSRVCSNQKRVAGVAGTKQSDREIGLVNSVP